MAGESLIVGYRRDDPRRYLCECMNLGWWSSPDGACVVCGREVWLNNSGRTAHRERDSALICRFDYENGVRDQVSALEYM